MDVRLPDGTVVQNVPEGTTRAQLMARVEKARAKKRADSGSWVTDEMSFADKAFAGAGKAASDLGLGIRQITGNASQAEVDEVKKRDAQLMDTGAGMAGNVAGNVAMAVIPGLGAAGAGKAVGAPLLQAGGKYLLSSPATLGGAVTQGTMGAVQSGLQPVATGESRAGNTMLGAVGGAAVPVAGMALKGGKAALEPLYEGGREQILARALRTAAGENTDDVISRLSQAKELIPGSAPTAAEVADSGGIAAMQRAAAAVDPEAYATRAAQQNEARVAALQGLAGSTAQKQAADTARQSAAGPLYRQAIEQGADPQAAQALQPQIANLMERLPKSGMHGTVLDKAKELARLNGDVMDDANSIKGLHWVKLAVDDLLSSGKQTGLGKEMTRGLIQFKDDLLTVMDDLSPAYGQARQTFATLSKPINQMDVAQQIADKSINPLTGSLQPQAFARALSDDTAAAATGFNKATLANTMDPQQLATLNALKGDLARSVAARDLGRGAGSDTVQKLAMTNLMERSGLPVGVLNVPGVGRMGNWAYSVADDKMKDVLAKALLDPKETAKIMKAGTPSQKAQMLALILRSGATPIGVGAPAALLDARQ
jgi:hypothetical protein